ncbi:MAG TPA: hypothetical protein VKP78_02845, partial [bacterium]|nr:hypothetical protein [bacterium]
MSRAFLDRNSQNDANSNDKKPSQPKVDYQAQMKRLDMNINNPGWNTTDISPAQMFAEEEDIQRKTAVTDINNDKALEMEADRMGAKAARGESTGVQFSAKSTDTKGKTIQKADDDETFVVPEGWGLPKIAEHLGVSVEALKEANRDKLKTWGDVRGFNAGEIITVPGKGGENQEEVDPVERMIELYISYLNGELDMPDFARALLPFVSSDGDKILVIFNQLQWNHQDNLAYALAENSSDTKLASFDLSLLQRMQSELSNPLSTTSWEENYQQRTRIESVLNVETTDQASGLADIINSDSEKGEKAEELISYVRDELENYPPKVKAFKNQSNYSETEKLRILGKVASLTGRLEILLGTIFYEGSGSANTWESEGSNVGDDEFLGYYQETQHGVVNQGSEWCAMFVASILNEALGFAPVDENGERASRGGYGWITWNVTSLHDSVTNHDGVNDDYEYDTRHVKKISNEAFNGLREDIVDEADQEERYNLVKSFFDENFIPQAGDLLAVGSKTSLGEGSETSGLEGFNHSTMIEKVIDEPAKNKIYFSTIEGNADQRAGGRLIDLTQSTNNSQDDLSFVTQVSRVGIDNYGVGTNINDGTKDKDLTEDSSENWTENDLVLPLTEMSKILQNYAAKNDYIQQSNYGDSIAQIIDKDVSGNIH